jgi:YVTN family beta-propeller protein
MKLPLSKKTAIITVILLAVLLNLSIFCLAYPITFKPESPTLARDFSAYYMGAWRLFHNPTQVYTVRVQMGDYQTIGQAQPFKYTPSFLILFAPFLGLSYQSALSAFDIMQFLLILVLAFFVYKLVKDKNPFFASIVAVIVLVCPSLFLPSSGYSLVNSLQTLSPNYYSGYFLANAHILQTVLLVGALYMGFTKKPWLSALLFTFGSFDPRGALFALPLLLWYNRHSMRKFISGSAVFLLATNLPFFLYYGVGFAFLKATVSASTVSHMYIYDWIPIYAVASITILEIITALFNRTHTKNSHSKALGIKLSERFKREKTKTLRVACILLPFFFVFSASVLLPQLVQAQTNTVMVSIPVGNQPYGVATTPNGDYVYASNYQSDSVTVISTAKATVTATIPVGHAPSGVSVTPNGDYVYVANQLSDTVSVINTTTNKVTVTIPVGSAPAGVSVTPNSDHVYVTNELSNSVSVIDTATNTVTATIPVGSAPYGLAVTPNGQYIYIAEYYNNSVLVVSTATNRITATVKVEKQPYGVAVTPNGDYVYVTNKESDTVSIIDTASNTVAKTLHVQSYPYGLAVSPNGANIYVANGNSNSVSVINTTTNTVTATIPVGDEPIGVAITPNGDWAYVTNVNSNSISVIYIANSTSSQTADPTATSTVAPTPTIPEFSGQLLVIISVVLTSLVVSAFITAKKKKITENILTNFFMWAQ